MDLRILTQFVAVAEELHFARAARRLNMAQPPLSQAIAKLEAQLGVKLFDRTSRQVKLTDAGRHLLDEAGRLLDRASHLKDTMHAMARGQAGQVIVGYNATSIHGFLAPLLARFARKWPTINLQLREMTSDQQLAQLRARRLHVGFVRIFGDDAGLQSRLVYEEPYVLAIPRKHRLAKQRKIKLAELQEVGMIRFPRDAAPSYQDWLLHSLSQAGLTPKVTIEATSGYANTALVAAGLGVSFAPQSLTRWNYPGVVYRPIGDKLPLIQTHMAWQDQSPPAAVRTFIEFIKLHRAMRK